MSFASPGLLWLLLMAPVLVAVYVLLMRRVRAAVYPNLAIVRTAITPGHRIRRHVPPALLLLAAALRMGSPGIILGRAKLRERIKNRVNP